MAGSKKKRDGYTSKGERNNVSKSCTKAERRERSPLDVHLNKMKSFQQGRNVFVTIPNPNTNETNKRFIRVKANTIWKKTSSFQMKQEG